MPERPIYCTQPDQDSKKSFTIGETGCLSLLVGGFLGGVTGGVSSFIWGSDVGLGVGVEVGVGTGACAGGAIIGITSAERAVNFAKAGRKKRAYVEVLRASLESAIGLAISGGTAGYAINDIWGAIIGGATGAFIGGGGVGKFAYMKVSKCFKEGN